VQSADSAAKQTLTNTLFVNQKLVGIKLEEALKENGSLYNLQLQEGDIIRIPKQNETVQAFGAVFVPKKIVYRSNLSFKDVINESGGFTNEAMRRRSYVVYPNGEVAATKKVLFVFNRFPKMKPGSEVYVPLKKERKSNSTQEILSISTAVVGIAAMVFGIVNLAK